MRLGQNTKSDSGLRGVRTNVPDFALSGFGIAETTITGFGLSSFPGILQVNCPFDGEQCAKQKTCMLSLGHFEPLKWP